MSEAHRPFACRSMGDAPMAASSVHPPIRKLCASTRDFVSVMNLDLAKGGTNQQIAASQTAQQIAPGVTDFRLQIAVLFPD